MRNSVQFDFHDREFNFGLTPTAIQLIIEIFSDNYKILAGKLEFEQDDIVLDIGANEGMFSIFMAKLFPQVKVYAFEPVPRTYYQLIDNIKLNKCDNITPFNLGAGKKGQTTELLIVSKEYSGGSSAVCDFDPENHEQVVVDLVSLDEVFTMLKIPQCRLLKVDIEGSEYEVFYSSSVLPRVDYLVMESHWNNRIKLQGWNPQELQNWVSKQTNLLSFCCCKMAE